ncbi:MAG: flagellar export protein FliJ [Pseudomonadales bacterium]|jgi:flagellar export protein FliJ
MIKAKSRALPLLVRLAENKVKGVLHRVGEIKNMLAKLDERLEQLKELRVDYLERLRSLQLDKGLSEAQNLRRFIKNLLDMEDRLKAERESIEGRLAQAMSDLAKARIEQKKMESLLERQTTRDMKAEEEKEQRAMDAAGIARFNRQPV